MSRSLKKPPFVHYKLMKRVDDAHASNSKSVIKTWSRASTITPDFVGLTISGAVFKNSLMRSCDAAARCTIDVTQPIDATGQVSMFT